MTESSPALDPKVIATGFANNGQGLSLIELGSPLLTLTIQIFHLLVSIMSRVFSLPNPFQVKFPR